MFFELPPKFAKKNGPKKKDDFSLFAKHRVIKKPFCCNPPFYPKIGVFQLVFFETQKDNDVQQKHNFKSATKTKIRKRDSKRKEDRKPKKRENIDEGKLCN